MQSADIHRVKPENRLLVVEMEKTTTKLPPEAGVEWPPLLTKKWLAAFYGCLNRGQVNSRRFRANVLTPEVLEKANIDPQFAYSRKCKTFTAIQSLMLTKILRGLCLIAFLFAATITQAQNKIEYSRDSTLRDTFPGMVLMTDSIVRMVYAGAPGEYRFENVLSSIVVEAVCVKEYRFLIKAADGSADPFDLTQRFFYIAGGQIDPNRILLFRETPKK